MCARTCPQPTPRNCTPTPARTRHICRAQTKRRTHLQVLHWVPVVLQEHHSVCAGQVQAQATNMRGQQQHLWGGRGQAEGRLFGGDTGGRVGARSPGLQGAWRHTFRARATCKRGGGGEAAAGGGTASVARGALTGVQGRRPSRCAPPPVHLYCGVRVEALHHCKAVARVHAAVQPQEADLGGGGGRRGGTGNGGSEGAGVRDRGWGGAWRRPAERRAFSRLHPSSSPA